MILSPLQNTGILNGTTWIQKRPVVTQKFGANPEWYHKFGWKGHEGLDFRAAVGTPVFSPIDGDVRIVDHGDKDYGLHFIITNKRLRVILAHLSRVDAISSSFVHMGDYVGKTGNTGNSTAPHLHMTVQQMFEGSVFEKGNGYGGGFDPLPFIITWKGSLKTPTHE